MDPRKVVPVLVVIGIALGVAALALTLRDDGGDGGENDRSAAASTTTTTTTTAPVTTTQPPATTTPAAPPAQTPATTTPPGSVIVVPTPPTEPAPTEAPPTSTPDTADDDDTGTATTSAPPTTEPDDDGDNDDDGDAIERDTVVYSPPDAPKRRGELLVPADHRSTAIVLVHGGSGQRGSRRNVRAWANAYADAGYVTLSIDYFLFKDTTPSPVFPVPERDVKAAVQYLRQHATELGIDPDRIVVQGFSAGARLGAEAYTSGDDPFFEGEGRYDDGTSDAVNGFIGFYGAYDGRQAEAEQYYGGPRDSDDPEVQERYAQADSIANAGDADGPALLFHGDADQVVPIEQSTAFGDALTASDQDATVAIVPGANHGFDRAARRLTPEGEEALTHALNWLAQKFPESG